MTRGNGFVQRMAIQAKLKVGAAGDRYEQEADRVADQVMRTISGGVPDSAEPIQRQEGNKVRAKTLASSVTPLTQEPSSSIASLMQRQNGGVQTKRGSTAESFDAGSDFESRLSATRGGGRPLPDNLRMTMEEGFGADFSRVRIHAGGDSAQLNDAVSAQAFTHGNDIYLGASSSLPGTHAGTRLLAHELTHTLQQTGERTQMAGSHTSVIQRAFTFEKTEWHLALSDQFRLVKESNNFGEVVMKFTDGNLILWVKTGDNADHAIAAETLISSAAVARKDPGSFQGKWKIRTPKIRKPTEDELESIINAIPQPTKSLSSAKIRQSYAEGKMTISTNAKGEEMGNDAGVMLPEHAGIFGNDKNFQESLGYTTILDLIIGNFDRTLRVLAPKNWKVNIGSPNVMYLFDNLDRGFGFEMNQDAWESNEFVLKARRSQLNEFWEEMAMNRWIQEDRDIIPKINDFKAHFIMGMRNAIRDLEKIRKKVEGSLETSELKDELIHRINYIM